MQPKLKRLFAFSLPLRKLTSLLLALFTQLHAFPRPWLPTDCTNRGQIVTVWSFVFLKYYHNNQTAAQNLLDISPDPLQMLNVSTTQRKNMTRNFLGIIPVAPLYRKRTVYHPDEPLFSKMDPKTFCTVPKNLRVSVIIVSGFNSDVVRRVGVKHQTSDTPYRLRTISEDGKLRDDNLPLHVIAAKVTTLSYLSPTLVATAPVC